ncbi:hypothetical protein L1987_21641 [Smallanthus sonchifolius]|uniref:Uncharacterized protein n=1 Tax=Smallanthus sonchifolius TaxID=185202 RepID=A0ACB9IE53_9ASTR|nr:hypothetical protein L1987_21641 [Smallanthus sonchifolius]
MSQRPGGGDGGLKEDLTAAGPTRVQSGTTEIPGFGQRKSTTEKGERFPYVRRGFVLTTAHHSKLATLAYYLAHTRLSGTFSSLKISNLDKILLEDR